MRKSKKRQLHQAKRDLSTPIATAPVLSPVKLSSLAPIGVPKQHKNLRLFEDRRTFHPQGKQRPARSVQKASHRLKVAAATKPSVTGKTHRLPRLPHQVQFQAPKSVLICIRRKRRRQVILALGKSRAGARARRHRQSEYSNIRC